MGSKEQPHLYKKPLPPPGYAILGDSGYPDIAAPIVLTPYKDATRPTELRFNTAHARARSVVERAFGLKKGRWRSVFTKALEVSAYKILYVVAACAAMHNVCMRMGGITPEELVEDDIGADDVEDNTEPPSQDPEAAQMRDHVAAKLSCPVPSGYHDYHRVVSLCFFLRKTNQYIPAIGKALFESILKTDMLSLHHYTHHHTPLYKIEFRPALKHTSGKPNHDMQKTTPQHLCKKL